MRIEQSGDDVRVALEAKMCLGFLWASYKIYDAQFKVWTLGNYLYRDFEWFNYEN